MTDKDLFGADVPPPDPFHKVVDGAARNKDGSYKVNPCLKTFGPGPEGAKCRGCKHLARKEFAKTYIKCKMRTEEFWKSSPKSDHRAGWDACGKYEPK